MKPPAEGRHFFVISRADTSAAIAVAFAKSARDRRVTQPSPRRTCQRKESDMSHVKARRKFRKIAIHPVTIDALEERRLLATFTVTSNADLGVGTLREAIMSANLNP